MEKKWTKIGPVDLELQKELQTSLGVSELVASLLTRRGVRTFEEARSFFRPNKEALHDPFLMLGMDKAVERLVAAYEEREKVMVYGDYDVDGTTSVALVMQVLSKAGFVCTPYQPDRYAEGYGLSLTGVEQAKAMGCKVLVALDCGIKDVKAASLAATYGLDLIICDHHTPGEEAPQALAILNPKQETCTYPFKELCGCGIGFKLAEALIQTLNVDDQTVWDQLDLCALSIGADVVPIEGENRVLAALGLQKINTERRAGIAAILPLMKKREVSMQDLIFSVSPRINAAGRMASAQRAVDLLLADEEEAGHVLEDIEGYNQERRELDRATTKEALNLLEMDPADRDRKSTVVYQSGWHKGVIGIVAARLMDVHYRPTVVLTGEKGGEISGSARSVVGFNVYEAIAACEDLLIRYGGHKYAAGLTLKEENYTAFKERFEAAVAASIDQELLVPEIEIEEEVRLHQLTGKFWRILKQFEPFGPANERPVFWAKRAFDTGSARIVGEDHLKFSVYQDFAPQHRFDCIAFKQGRHLPMMQAGKPFDLVFTLEENEFRGQVNLQLQVQDIRPV